ncbi:D-alanyl-D-alanine carboxypeptidase [Brevibacillus laterosporus]|uniref:serine-type D-Ala-D-Ala carboxypeptidase n=2 Tax=Brevibacillus TaxID=55080 RepID=A0A0F7EI61_BRELA|nr:MULTISPECIES: D-alanyl-D-alanine carboxypeptidase family protein [Brevibacillus]AKF95399.1 peptidase S11 [Brevibacillus laterosporus]MCR8986141.1 D-alanyl-D-alanine carboxypeptidase [Brevibacillus laterosporus]MCZ0831874.1 D-alanyl-D-alanine carboxypeptidase [Brevibacillus halotolerans]GIO00253.1 D-alanyl-D-alanine carboxypeptidase DacB [Brevibacillus halotolerans]
MRYQRIIGVLVVFLLCVSYLGPQPRAWASLAPKVSAEAAAVIDVKSGRILYQKNGNKKMRIASLTKTLTAIVAIEATDIKKVVAVPDKAVGVEGSSIYLKRGEKLTLEELLYGLMLRSGNDAAAAIALQVGGSIEGFAAMMNEKAIYIGMDQSNFMNPHGLDNSKEHYSTAVDMAKLSAYALQNPQFQQIVSTKVKSISWEGEKWERRLQNKNKMLHLYDGADGVKTGYTKLAKRCLASSATRDGRQVAVITLNAPDDWNDHAILLDYGFQQFKESSLIHKGEKCDAPQSIKLEDKGKVELVSLADFTYPLKAGEEQHVSKKIQLFQKQVGHHDVNEHVGFVEIYLGKHSIGKIPLTLREMKVTDTFQNNTPSGIWKHVSQLLKGGLPDA